VHVHARDSVDRIRLIFDKPRDASWLVPLALTAAGVMATVVRKARRTGGVKRTAHGSIHPLAKRCA
jgi:hypothetical protein